MHNFGFPIRFHVHILILDGNAFGNNKDFHLAKFLAGFQEKKRHKSMSIWIVFLYTQGKM